MENYIISLDFTVPGWANWIAQDSDGEWYCYQYEPHLSDIKNHWYSTKGKTLPICAQFDESMLMYDYKDSLHKLSDE